MAALSKIREAGFSVVLVDDKLSINPASALTPNQREFLKSHKSEIINELRTEASVLSACDRQKLLAYLDAIGETDPAMIDECLTDCGKDAVILARELQQADDCLQIHAGDFTGMVQCSGCRHLSGDTCQFHGWRVVVDKWRRCTDFEPLEKTPVSTLITCKGCSHFQSFNTHGGGAGACRAGVMPFGACWWADTLHDCKIHQIIRD